MVIKLKVFRFACKAHFFSCRSLGEIISAFRVQELRLSLTQGQWRHSKWGHPMFPAPPGALVATRILPSTTTNEVDTAWAGLTSALAGLLCASLNTLDKTEAVEPKYSFQVGTIIMIRYSDHQ